jgi:hypothetical protein
MPRTKTAIKENGRHIDPKRVYIEIKTLISIEDECLGHLYKRYECTVSEMKLKGEEEGEESRWEKVGGFSLIKYKLRKIRAEREYAVTVLDMESSLSAKIYETFIDDEDCIKAELVGKDPYENNSGDLLLLESATMPQEPKALAPSVMIALAEEIFQELGEGCSIIAVYMHPEEKDDGSLLDEGFSKCYRSLKEYKKFWSKIGFKEVKGENSVFLMRGANWEAEPEKKLEELRREWKEEMGNKSTY